VHPSSATLKPFIYIQTDPLKDAQLETKVKSLSTNTIKAPPDFGGMHGVGIDYDNPIPKAVKYVYFDDTYGIAVLIDDG